MLKHKVLGGAALLLFGPVASALAGSVYVPLATDHTLEGVRYRTQVWATNTDTTLRQFTTYFIPSDSDGTDRPENWGTSTAVAPGTTMLLGTIADSGETGVLEISGAAEIVVGARMVPTVDGVTGLGAAMPVVSSENLFAADATAHLQGWIRSGELVSDFGIVNLGSAAATCSIGVFRSDGTQIQSTAVIGVRALGHRHFDDALAILGEQAVAAVRSETSCNQPFYVYLRTYDRTSGELFFTLPSVKLADSTLQPPGEEPPPASCASGAAYCFQLPGTFFAPRQNNQVDFFDIPVPAGDYRRLRATMDFFHGGWNAARPDAAHNILWLARDGRHFDLFGYSNVYGPPKNEILLRHGIGSTATQKARVEAALSLTPQRVYRLEYDYDAGQRTLRLRIFDAQGNQLVNLSDRTNVATVRVDPGVPYTLGLSFNDGQNPAEVTTYGWEYRNFVAEFFD